MLKYLSSTTSYTRMSKTQAHGNSKISSEIRKMDVKQTVHKRLSRLVPNTTNVHNDDIMIS